MIKYEQSHQQHRGWTNNNSIQEVIFLRDDNVWHSISSTSLNNQPLSVYINLSLQDCIDIYYKLHLVRKFSVQKQKRTALLKAKNSSAKTINGVQKYPFPSAHTSKPSDNCTKSKAAKCSTHFTTQLLNVLFLAVVPVDQSKVCAQCYMLWQDVNTSEFDVEGENAMLGSSR